MSPTVLLAPLRLRTSRPPPLALLERTDIGSTEHGGAPLLFPSMVQQDEYDIQGYEDECFPDACNIGGAPAEVSSGSCGGVSTSHHARDAVQVVQVVDAEAQTVNAVVPNTLTDMILGSHLFEEKRPPCCCLL
ncbi:unnamed protein product [Prorocentrum cordatum]|uniref:Uncharacterized protein n=1 Tax=Prorocentrum cordatum TaxID=2364126 RepID=A0ABN9UU07_9DINO|nr:unnamed protein product [Polarella glacialis]